MWPVHAALLAASFVATGLVGNVSLAVAARATRFGDRRAWLLLALVAPSLGLGAMGLTILSMLWRGCSMFTPLDVRLSLAVLAGEGAIVLTSLSRTPLRSWWAWRRFAALAAPCEDARARRILGVLASRMHVRTPHLWQLPVERPVAFVTGIFAPRLVLSSWLLERLDADELEALLAHELAHLRHGDNAIAWMANWLKALSFFLPTSRRAFDALLAEREWAADAIAATITRKPLALASALLKVARHAVPSEPLRTHFADASATVRAERLLDGVVEFRPAGPLSGGAVLLAAVLLALALLPFAWMTCTAGVSCLMMAL